jgi:hypothetical protein
MKSAIAERAAVSSWMPTLCSRSLTHVLNAERDKQQSACSGKTAQFDHFDEGAKAGQIAHEAGFWSVSIVAKS